MKKPYFQIEPWKPQPIKSPESAAKAELTFSQKTRIALLVGVLYLPLIYVWKQFGLGALFLTLAGGVFLFFFGGMIYFIARKDGIAVALEEAARALAVGLLELVVLGFAGMVGWEVVVSVWRHFPQGW
jgi:hypothetical protein